MIKKGFTLIEIMVVIILIGLVTAMGLPRLFRRPIPVTQEFMHRLNTLVTQASGQAQQEREPRKVLFNLSARQVEIQTLAGRRVSRQITIPSVVSVEDVIINGESQFKIGGGTKRMFYFLINPEGISQEVQLILNEQAGRDQTRTYEFYLNPFTSLFRVQ